jgi:hypothetical protein
MKRLLTAAATLAVLATALPAAAQPWDRGGRSGPDGVERIERRIDRGVRNGSLTLREARSLERQVDDLRRLERRFLRDGYLDRSEARELDRRTARLEARLSYERRDADRSRDYGYGGRYGGYR